MPVSVVLEGPPRFTIGRVFVRGISAVTGGVLVAIALLAVVPAFGLSCLFAVWIFGQRLDDDWPRWLTDRLWITWLVVMLGTILAYRVGMYLIRGRRRTVLFLRRFGFNDATEVMTNVTRKIGGFWRIITLDDAEIEAMGHSADTLRRMKRLDKAGDRLWKMGARLLQFTLIVAFGAEALYGVVVWRRYTDSRELDVDFEAFIDIVRVGLVIWGVIMALLLLRLASTSLLAQASSVRNRIEETEQSKRIRVENAMTLTSVAASAVHRQTRKVISPRLIVVKVATPDWKAAVETFAAATTLSLVDVSIVSENVLWEIEYLQREITDRCVYVGRYDLLSVLKQMPEPGSLEEKVQQRLAGVSVLAYTMDSKGRRRFTRALRATLDDRAEHASR